jgi:hypothetical protein
MKKNVKIHFSKMLVIDILVLFSIFSLLDPSTANAMLVPGQRELSLDSKLLCQNISAQIPQNSTWTKRFDFIGICEPDYYLWAWNPEPIKEVDQLNLILSDFQENQKHVDEYRKLEEALSSALQENKRILALLEERETEIKKLRKDHKDELGKSKQESKYHSEQSDFFEYKFKRYRNSFFMLLIAICLLLMDIYQRSHKMEELESNLKYYKIEHEDISELYRRAIENRIEDEKEEEKKSDDEFVWERRKREMNRFQFKMLKS